MTFFFFKRLVGGLAQPAPLILLFLGLALVLLWGTGGLRRRLGLASLVISSILFAATVFPYPGRYTARLLERGRVPIRDPSTLPDVPRLIVVLGNGVEHPDDPKLPALTRLNDTARARLVEGVRLARLFPEAKLATSGYGMGLENCADAMADAAIELGIDNGRIERLGWPKDTEEEARATAKLADGGVVLVVTSAVHMERAMRAFRGAGVQALAAPCDYAAPLSDQTLAAVNRKRWRPRGVNLTNNEKAWHEALGLVYNELFGDKGESGGGDEGVFGNP